MDTKHTITLPRDYIDRCRKHGEEIVRSYEAGENARSRSVSSHGADTNIKLQVHAKMGECAFAVWAGLDPFAALNWKNRPDQGCDVVYAGSRLDIKTTMPNGQYLLWPINKNHLFEEKLFDALVFVRGNVPTFTIAGWIDKADFREKHGVATSLHVLDEGTWFVHQSQLWSMDDFSPAAGA